MRFVLPVIAALALAACTGNIRQAEMASFDLGAAAIAWKPADLPLRDVEVAAPSWLGGSALQYRLLYADAMRRQAYAESRWAAPPAELLARALNRQTQMASGPGGCRLRLDLDELVQVFATPTASSLQLDIRATLLASRGDSPLLRKAFSVVQPALNADARGGVAATGSAVQVLAGELSAWLAQAARENPALAERCR